MSALLDDGWFHKRFKYQDRQRWDGRYKQKQNEEQSIHDSGYQLPLAGNATTNIIIVVVFVAVCTRSFLFRDDDLEMASNCWVVRSTGGGSRGANVWYVIVGCSRLVDNTAWPASRLHTFIAVKSSLLNNKGPEGLWHAAYYNILASLTY